MKTFTRYVLLILLAIALGGASSFFVAAKNTALMPVAGVAGEQVTADQKKSEQGRILQVPHAWGECKGSIGENELIFQAADGTVRVVYINGVRKTRINLRYTIERN